MIRVRPEHNFAARPGVVNCAQWLHDSSRGGALSVCTRERGCALNSCMFLSCAWVQAARFGSGMVGRRRTVGPIPVLFPHMIYMPGARVVCAPPGHIYLRS